jgi:hypothetical protein
VDARRIQLTSTAPDAVVMAPIVTPDRSEAPGEVTTRLDQPDVTKWFVGPHSRRAHAAVKGSPGTGRDAIGQRR